MGKNKNQQGFGLISLFSGAFLLMFFSMMAVSLLPPYLENFSVRSCLTSLSEDSAILNSNEDSIKTALLKRFSVSNVSHVTKKDISVVKGKKSVEIIVAYNVQAKFIKNVDFILRFDEKKEVVL